MFINSDLVSWMAYVFRLTIVITELGLDLITNVHEQVICLAENVSIQINKMLRAELGLNLITEKQSDEEIFST